MIDPVAISFFGLKIHWYGIVYALGFLFSYFYIINYSKKYKIKNEISENIFFYFVIFSLIGGRLFHIVFYNITYYVTNPVKIFYVWEGGMSIHGGIFFGALVLYYFSKKYKIEYYNLTDTYVIPASLALSFGRLANFVNQELIGIPTKNNFGVIFDRYDTVKRHPVQIYESFKNMITFQILFYLDYFKNLKSGYLTALFLIIYNWGRFFTDFFRVHDLTLGFISMGQFLCVVYGLWGIIMLYLLSQKTNKNKIN